MVTMELEKESIWNDNRYAPRRNPRTGPNAAILYIQPANIRTSKMLYHTEIPQMVTTAFCLITAESCQFQNWKLTQQHKTAQCDHILIHKILSSLHCFSFLCVCSENYATITSVFILHTVIYGHCCFTVDNYLHNQFL